ncbi:MAG: hypothetical protein K8823_148 [Cenarchaeum symbiont of Oopsacas minuta]|nr:hypothetical protein [Cenarchaeum symbiont of Oopsacas minuta]
MSATETLRKDHQHVMRLDAIIQSCYKTLYSGIHVPISDIRQITVIISEFFDSIHYTREEDSYFACVAGYGELKDDIRKFMIEHEFGRRIASKISKHLDDYKRDELNTYEPVARFLRTYSIYLNDHVSKEEKFFDQVESTILSAEEEREMYEQFNSSMATAKKLSGIIKQMEILEDLPWARIS